MYPTRDNPAFGAFVKTQIDSIKAAGHDVDLLVIDGRQSSWNYVSAVGRLRSMLARKNYDIVHAHYGLSGFVAAMQRRCPVVVSFCGDDLMGTSNGRGQMTLKSRVVVWLGQWAGRLVQGIIIKSETMQKPLKFTSSQERAVVIPNGVDLEMFHPIDMGEARKQLGLAPEKKYVLFPSMSSEPTKRLDLASHAVALARTSHPDIELLIPDRKPHEEMPVYMGASDVMIFTSDWEGSPNVIKEAMACNLPIVSVDAGDAWKVMNCTDGCYRAARTEADLSEKLSMALSRNQRSNGRDSIKHLEIGVIAGRVIDVYQTVLAN